MFRRRVFSGMNGKTDRISLPALKSEARYGLCVLKICKRSD